MEYTMTNTMSNTMHNNIVSTNGVNLSLFNDWLMFLDASKKTQETYTRAIKVFISYLEATGNNRPERADILAYKKALEEAGKAPSTINLYLTAVKQFFKWTEIEGYYPNVMANVKGEKINTQAHKKDYLTKDQISEILANVDRSGSKGLRDYAIISLMVTTGLRTVEVVRANVEDLRPRGNGVVLYVQGKGHTEKDDFVKIAAPVEKAIRAYLATRTNKEDGRPLFASTSNRDNGGRMETRSISRIVKDAFVGAGYDSSRLTAHSLRHTAATLNLLNGGSLEETKDLLRHTNINTTLIYAHALDRDRNNSESRVASLIFG